MKALRKKNTYSDENKREAVVLYLILGVMTKVSAQLNIPERTLNTWKTSAAWWPVITEEVHQEKTDHIRSRVDKVIELSFEQLEDRVRNGDEIMDKNGNKIRRKMSGRDLGIIAGIMVDKRQVLSHQPTMITGNVDGRLSEFMSKFEQLGRAMTAKTIEGEVIENNPNCLTANGGDG